MNETLAQFFISVAGAIIMLLLAAIAYFVKEWIKSTRSLADAVIELKLTIALLQTNQGNSAINCNGKHQVIDLRLNEHAKRLNEHGEAIAEMQANKPIQQIKQPKK